ncbi:BnaC02g46440D [Brassica napus]|uniref:BnaC02g46440D protein n=1 Tax=Brassica napus TaxID=3708 RepID=A0A078JS19_BRANA|nr:BnaC02g46440D [Brassica napus]
MFREQSDLEMNIRRSLNLLRGDFGTRRIGTIDFFQRDIHNGIQATKGISSGCYLQGIELWEYKWDTVNNGLCQGCQDLYMGAKQRIKKRDISRTEGACEVYIWTSDHGRLIDS